MNTPTFDVYPIVYSQGGKLISGFAVRESVEEGCGDSLFPTRDEAESYASLAYYRYNQRVANLERMEVEAALAAQTEAERNYLDGFEDGKPPREVGLIRKLLCKCLIRCGGITKTRRDIIRDRVAQGWVVEKDYAGVTIFIDPKSGTCLDENALTRRGMMYAQFLIDKARA